MGKTIRLHDLQYRYPGLAEFGLGPINMEIPAGKLSFWAGPNGSGKSTLASILCGELNGFSGTIEGLNGSKIRHHQSVAENLFPDLRVQDHFRLLAKREHDRAKEVERLFPELRTILSKYPDQVSGGQLQLVAFTTVLLERHQLYVFDEVLNHLDPQVAAKVIGYIQTVLVSREKANCIIISHDVTAIRKYADLLNVFADGHIVKQVFRDDLIDERFLAELLVNPGETKE